MPASATFATMHTMLFFFGLALGTTLALLFGSFMRLFLNHQLIFLSLLLFVSKVRLTVFPFMSAMLPAFVAELSVFMLVSLIVVTLFRPFADLRIILFIELVRILLVSCEVQLIYHEFLLNLAQPYIPGQIALRDLCKISLRQVFYDDFLQLIRVQFRDSDLRIHLHQRQKTVDGLDPGDPVFNRQEVRQFCLFTKVL